jgi:uncharacterized protein YggL (DUF469 family)
MELKISYGLREYGKRKRAHKKIHIGEFSQKIPNLSSLLKKL